MSRVIKCNYRKKNATGIRRNSFYQEQKIESVTGKLYPIHKEDSGILYYIDNKTEQLKAKNTLLLR